MVHGAVRSLFGLLGALFVGLLIVLPLLAWRLSSGPITLDFLTPYIEEALTAKEGGLSVRLDTTVLAMGKGSRMVEIRALDVRAYAGTSDQPIATVPELALTLNGKALLSGVLAPNSVRLYRPRLHLIRDEHGNFQWGVGEPDSGSDDVVRRLIDALVGEPDPNQPGRHLQRAAIIDADLVVDDLKLHTTWHAPDTDIELRRVPQGLAASARMVLDLKGEQGALTATASYAKADDSVMAELWLAGIRPAAFAHLGGRLTELKALDLPMAGLIRAKGTATGTVTELEFDLAGGTGTVDLPAPINVRRNVESVALRGGAFDGLTRARLDELSLDFGGPRVTLAATADGLGGDTKLKLDAVAQDVAMDELPVLWPQIVAPNAREWVVANLSKGIVREARATVSARSPAGTFDDLIVDHVDGELRGDGATVNYLKPMPVVKNAAAVATFDASNFRISVKGGELYGLRLLDGTIVLSGLDQIDQFADIDVTIAGPATDALKVIDHKPLRYASALGIDPATVGGDATTRLKLKFPLLKDLRLDDLAVKVHSSVKNVFLPKVVLGQDLTRGDLEFDVDTKGLDATGNIVLGTIPGELKWRENFSSKNVPFRSRYHVVAPRIDEDQRKQLGLDSVPFVSPFMAGPVAATVVATLQGGGKGDIEAKVDLSPAHMSLPGMGWRKEERTTGGALVLLKLDKNKIATVPHFAVTAGDLQTSGNVAFNGDGSVRRVEFNRLAYGGRTDVEGSIGFKGGALDIVMRGDSFNAEPLVSSGEETPAEADAPKRRQKADLPPMTISTSVKTMWLSKDGKLVRATANLMRDADDWRSMNIRGTVGDGKNFQMQMQPAGPKSRSLKVTSDDAGAVLSAFDTYDHMVGGKLEVEAAYDDSKDDQPLSGTIRISDYQIVNAPALARLLTVAALTGILDVLNGQGVSFTTLDAPFTLTDGLFQIKGARAYGPALGITSKGEVDLDHGRMALEGTVVPAYALNSVLGNIPVLGWLVTGGEKGGGLLAFNFTMRGPTQEPDVTVNPLSALTPGFLRHLFNIFDDGTETEARRRPSAVKPPPTGDQPASTAP
ncbi:MAG: AsmA-like C-terminal domain-containing protein [Rhodospirillaceae bacterium]|nr:AsmA-like C-terminal domain-containing protein [Rhodospirillales bacterium]